MDLTTPCSQSSCLSPFQGCYYFEPPTVADLDKLDLPAAFRYFSRSFQNPAEFTLCFTGSLKARHLSCSCQVSFAVQHDFAGVPLQSIAYSTDCLHRGVPFHRSRQHHDTASALWKVCHELVALSEMRHLCVNVQPEMNCAAKDCEVPGNGWSPGCTLLCLAAVVMVA